MGQISPFAPGRSHPYQQRHPQPHLQPHPHQNQNPQQHQQQQQQHQQHQHQHQHQHRHQHQYGHAALERRFSNQATPLETALPTPGSSGSMVPSNNDDLHPRPLSLHNHEREQLREALNEPDPFFPPPVLDSFTSAALEERSLAGYAPRYPTTDADAEPSLSGQAPGGVVLRDEPPFTARPRRPSYTDRFVASSAPPDVPLPPFVATNPSSRAPIHASPWTSNRARYSNGDMNQQNQHYPSRMASRIIRPPPGFESKGPVTYHYAPDEPRLCRRCYSAEAVYPAEAPSELSWPSTTRQDVNRPRTFDFPATNSTSTAPSAGATAGLYTGNAHINGTSHTNTATGLYTGMTIGSNTGSNTSNVNNAATALANINTTNPHTTNTTTTFAGGTNTNADNAAAGVSIADQNANGHIVNSAFPIPTHPNAATDGLPTYPTATSDRPPAYIHETYYGDEGDLEDTDDDELRSKLNRLLFRSASLNLSTLYPGFPIPTFCPEGGSNVNDGGEDDDNDNDNNFLLQPIPSTASTPPLFSQQRRQQAEQGEIPIVATIPLRALNAQQQQQQQQGTSSASAAIAAIAGAAAATSSSPLSSFFEEGTSDEEEEEDNDADSDISSDSESDWSTSSESSASDLAAARIFSPRTGSPGPVSAFDFSDDDDDVDDDDDDDDDDDEVDDDGGDDDDDDAKNDKDHHDEEEKEDESRSTTDSEAERFDFELELRNHFPSDWDWETLLTELFDV